MHNADFTWSGRVSEERLKPDKAEAITLVDRMLQAAAHQDVALLARMYNSSAVAVSPVFGAVVGREAIVRSWEILFSTLRDIRVHVSDVLVDEKRVAIISEISAVTDRDGWFGLPVKGATVEYRMLLLLTIVNGEIVRDERIYDAANLLKRLEAARVEEELNRAAEVQRALLPRTTYAGSICRAVGASTPCRSVGGDFFEFIDLPSGGLGLAIADVAGKGPSAALLAALIQGLLVSAANEEEAPAAVVSRVNERLASRSVQSRFATLTYCVASRDGQLSYCNAGHNPPILLSCRQTLRLEVGGPILGAFPGAIFRQGQLTISPKDLLVMFTDGVIEAPDIGGAEFGDDRLIEAVLRGAASPHAALEHVISSVRAFCGGTEQQDDLTIVAAEFL
ncbi:MAG: SpoIIE family protein phosphatase [Acidobacteriaceae bacterium]|nr:SpoIIE family protein phosphatase [Acidobacteriaceae bacterium]